MKSHEYDCSTKSDSQESDYSIFLLLLILMNADKVKLSDDSNEEN